MKKALYIFGAGGFGREVLSMIKAIDGWEVKAFIDDGIPRGTLIKGLEVIGGIDVIRDLPEDAAVVLAIGDPATKQKLSAAITRPIHFPMLIHPAAIIQDKTSVQIGAGTIIGAGAVLTTDIIIASHVLINLNATIGHDSSIGSCSSIMPGVNIAGEVSIGDAVLLGAGCNIRNKVHIGNNAKVGMGSVVLHDVRDSHTVVGVPARQMK
jgi:sugar O-acyltransferase (sialic acid O-acetyltransferase NeuD family)